MSRLLVNLALLPTKALVNAYTWTTLPLYAAAQRPWRRLKQSKSFGVRAEKDSQGRLIYSRKSPVQSNHPYLQCTTFNEIVTMLDRNKEIFGVRDVLDEVPQLDADGRPIMVDGRELKRIKLADD